MSWSQVIGHDREKKILQRAIIDEKIAHAYLLQGIEGIGKEALAIEFAKAVNCDNPNTDGNDSYESCGICKSCTQIDKLSSSNLDILFALPAGKSTDSKSDDPLGNLADDVLQIISEEIQLKAQDHYHKISIPKANQIKISSIRNLKKQLSLSGNIRGRRFVIISEAHNMTAEASNAFLKTLEEPHENITIFLSTSRPDKILQTIVSRCQVINCNRVPKSEISDYIIKKTGIDEASAKLAAQFGQGSVTEALASVSDEIKQERDQIVDILRSCVKPKKFRSILIGKINELIKESDKNRVRHYLALLMLWNRDAIKYIHQGSEAEFVNSDDSETIIKFAEHFKNRDIPSVINEIENAVNMIDANVNMQLILLSLFIRLRRIFIGNTL